MTKNLRVMTLNLRVSTADDGPNGWAQRWPHIKALVAAERPSLLGVQECTTAQMITLMGELPGYFAYMGPDTMNPAGLSIRNPIFICEDCPHPRREGVIPLNATGVIGQISWDGQEPRLAHWLVVDGIIFVNTHFDAWDNPRARLESARLIVDFLQDKPVAVVVGDLNCPPESEPLAVFKEAGFSLVKEHLPPGVDRRTFHKFTGEGLAELDYILTRGAEVQRAAIPRPRSETPYLSDHDPVVAALIVP